MREAERHREYARALPWNTVSLFTIHTVSSVCIERHKKCFGRRKTAANFRHAGVAGKLHCSSSSLRRTVWIYYYHQKHAHFK